MIDYEKLKIAHELANKLSLSTDSQVRICVSFNCEVIMYDIYGPTEVYYNIDKLISKLNELTPPKRKYEVGETWWYLELDIGDHFPIPDFMVITEGNKDWSRKDEEWYPSKQALIESQIFHWQSLRAPTIQESCERPANMVVEFMEKEKERTKRVEELIVELGAKFISEECQHEYQKTLANSGMYFLDKCKKCMHEKPWECDCMHEFDNKFYNLFGQECNPGENLYLKFKCKKCELWIQIDE